jgi:hypothetical protein
MHWVVLRRPVELAALTGEVKSPEVAADPELFLGQTAGIEVHTGSPKTSGLNPQSPVEQVSPVDQSISTTQTRQVHLNLNLGGASIRFLNPA